MKARIILFISLFIFLAILLPLRYVNRKTQNTNPILSALIPIITPSITPTYTPTPSFTPTPSPTTTPSPTPRPFTKILFGIGSQAGSEIDSKIVHDAPVHMLSSWYNGPSDLDWMRVQQNDLIPRLYARKFVVHLITWTDLPELDIDTPHGHACGRPYPVSSQVVGDMSTLAEIYKGPGPLYLSLFTEFPSFTCVDNNWNENEAYWQTLKDNFRAIKDNVHRINPQAKVGLSWGGWVGLYDNQETQGGRSLITHFADVLQESDFTAFQAMESDSNIPEIRSMTKLLGAYRKPIMLTHYKPSNHSDSVFQQDMNMLFTETMIKELTSYGLFAMSFMDEDMIENETSYQIVKNGITKFGR